MKFEDLHKEEVDDINNLIPPVEEELKKITDELGVFVKCGLNTTERGIIPTVELRVKEEIKDKAEQSRLFNLAKERLGEIEKKYGIVFEGLIKTTLSIKKADSNFRKQNPYEKE